MTLLKILGIDRYTTKFKEWIGNKFIAKGGLKTINNQSIEGTGNIEVQANAEIILPESIELTNVKTTAESRVFRAFYNIQTDEFIINGNDKMESVHVWLLNRGASLGQILNITVVDEYSWLYHCVAEVILNPIINVQFNYLDTHYSLTWNTDSQSWDVTKTPINTGADWNAQEGESGYIKNKPFNKIVQKTFDILQESGESIENYYNIDLFADYYLENLPLNEFDTPYEWWVEIKGKNADKYINVIVPLYLFNNLSIGDTFKYNDFTFGKSESEYGYNNYYIKSYTDKLKYKLTINIVRFIDKMKSEYIENTVIKTTPQKLLDTDRNQALANLGIDPVIWKYLINPCIIKKGEKIPDDLLDENNNLKYDMHPNMYRVRGAGNNYLSIGGPNDIIDGHGNGVLEECAPGTDVWFSTDGYWDNEV